MDIDEIIFECTEHDSTKAAIDDCDICDASGLIVDKMPVQQTIVESVDIVSSPTKQFLPLDAWRLKAVFDMYEYKANFTDYRADVIDILNSDDEKYREPIKTIVLSELDAATVYKRDSNFISVLGLAVSIDDEKLDSMWLYATELPS